jgi:DNA mismatch endonuclease (patch repair protein)
VQHLDALCLVPKTLSNAFPRQCSIFVLYASPIPSSFPICEIAPPTKSRDPSRISGAPMDKISADQRSSNMRAIRSKNTLPELFVRQTLRDIGLTGYRLHRKDLPGKPDIAFVGRRKAIFVHGCFWHGHNCNAGLRRPRSRPDYWPPKIARNQQRDANHVRALTSAGWAVLVLWECELKQACLRDRLSHFMENCTQ